MQLIEHYLSLQGEGLRAGKLSYFVRFARCNLACSWCDSTYTFGPGTEVPFDAVVHSIQESRAGYVCLTGGEPLLHPEDCLALIRAFPGLRFDVETGGSLDIRPVLLPNVSVIMDWKLEHSQMSRKMKSENLPLLRPESDLLKFVTDGSETEKEEILRLIHSSERWGFPVSIQPVYGIPLEPLADWVLAQRNPRLQFNLQVHKLIWGAERTGV